MSHPSDLIRAAEALIPHAMARDRHRARLKLKKIKQLPENTLSKKKYIDRLLRLQKQLNASKRKKEWRKHHLPTPGYPVVLPILEKKGEIISAIKKHPVLIVSGETGSGKTTQIPKFCLEAGRGINGKIGCTQPRRIAAVTVSDRIAEELGEVVGQSVGYKIRFTDKTRKDGFIKIMTDGILLAEAQHDPFLFEYDTLIVDEAHERSLNIDFVLGILKTLLETRKDLKLIITSATIDTEKFSKAFDDAPVIEVSGRTYPVEVEYMALDSVADEDDESTYVEKAVLAVDALQRNRSRGDILVFMPTEQDILETRELIEGRNYPNVTVFPLFARLSAADQKKVFGTIAGRKIIIATNIAETSITIPGIKYVIDTGLARIPRYSPRTRTTSLPISPISKSSADQRKGRCGRVQNGVCVRLFSEKDYESRPLYTPPEILRANLAEVILRMMSLNLGDISNFPFVDPPAAKSVSDGFDLLTELGAISQKSPLRRKTGKRFVLTPKGQLMSRIPVDPRISCMLIEARRQGCLKEVLIIASVLSIMDPRERPVEKAQAADEKHRPFSDPLSDFLTLINIWHRYHETKKQVVSNNQMKRFCKEHFLSYRRMREWQDIHSQLSDILKEAGLDQTGAPKKPAPEKKARFHPLYSAIHKSVLSGFLSNIAVKKENNIYKAPKGREVMIFPGSALFGKAPAWIVAGEVVQTSRIYARTVGSIDENWLEDIGKSLCKYTWQNPRWDSNRGEVTATEQVSLFGLIIVNQRRVSYGSINPKEATAIFIREALLLGGINTAFGFIRHNQNLIETVQNIENKLRKKDILISHEALFSFYENRLELCTNTRQLKQIIKKNQNDHFLRMNQKDLFRYMPDDEELALYPDQLRLGQQDYPCEYHFEPGEACDGLTVKIPLTMAPEIRADDLDWLVPGLHKEKITALIKGLPKSYRKQLVPVADTVDIILAEMPRNEAPLLTMLADYIHQRFGVNIPAPAWNTQSLPDHLKMRIAITGNNGKEIRSGREPSVLTQTGKAILKTDGLSPIKKKWERTGIEKWDFPDLPESIRFKEKNGTQWILYPGLKTDSSANRASTPQSINLVLFLDYHKAKTAHENGVAALYANTFSKDLRYLKKVLSLPPEAKKVVQNLGGAPYIEAQLYDRVMVDLFHKNIRKKVEFETYAETVFPLILKKGQEIIDQCLPVMVARYETKIQLETLKKENRFNPVAVQFFEELSNQLDRLVPPQFISLYDGHRIKNIPRYLEAMIIRAQRALVSMEKDQAKARDINVFADKLGELLAGLTPDTSRDKREAIEELFWSIEEYKVSVFAQELKTPIKISPKKLRLTINDIERMV